MMARAFRRVFTRPAYLALAVVTSIIVFALATWLPNLGLIARIALSPGISWSEKFALPLSLLGSITTNFTPLSALYTIVIAILFGMYLAMTVYYLRRKIVRTWHSTWTGVLGIGSGALGVGCAACGSFLFTGTLALVGASGALALLPLGGSEFGILGALLLALSVYLTARQITNPAVCATNSITN